MDGSINQRARFQSLPVHHTVALEAVRYDTVTGLVPVMVEFQGRMKPGLRIRIPTPKQAVAAGNGRTAAASPQAAWGLYVTLAARGSRQLIGACLI